MARFNFDVKREVKRPRSGNGKMLRVVILFCLVAAVTAMVIYAVVPKSDPETPAAGDPAADNSASAGSNSSSELTPVENPDAGNTASAGKNSSGTAGNGGVSGGGEKEPAPGGEEKEPASGESGESGGAGESSGNNATAGNQGGDISVSSSGGSAKYDPSSTELLKNTDRFREMFNNGSWKKQADVIIHTVAAGDSLERLARKYHNTVQFLQKGNGIGKANTIRIGQKIHLLRADGWQIVISRKKAELQLDRIIGGNAVPMAVFPCRIKSGAPAGDMMISRRFRKPYYVDANGRKFAPGTQGNPYGDGLISLAHVSAPDAFLNISIHGQGDAQATDRSVDAGGIALHNQDVALLYLLVPEKTPVKIVE